LNTETEYFLIDRFSLGGSFVLLDTSTSATNLALGPSATFFFLRDGKWASYIGLGFGFGLTSATTDWALLSDVGLEYFITPSVAIGPSFFYNHSNDGGSVNRYGVLANFGIYL